jgi:hypothetical protein
MADVDLQTFATTLQDELQRFHPEWLSRVDAGAKRTAAQLWANGFTVKLDLTENHLEPGSGSRKYDEIRMVIFKESRDPMDQATWLGGSTEIVGKKFWQSANYGSETRWRDESGTEVSIQQVFSAIRMQLIQEIEGTHR